MAWPNCCVSITKRFMVRMTIEGLLMQKLPKGRITSRLREKNSDRKLGYFFVVDWDHPDPNTYLEDGTHAKCVFDSKRRLEVNVISYDKRMPQISDSRCFVYPDIPHFMTQQLDNVVVQWRSSDPDDFDGPDDMLRDGLIYCWETGYHFIGRPLWEAFKQEGLTGLVVSRVAPERIGEAEPEWLDDDEIVMIDGKCSPYGPAIIVPDEANRCEYCGFAPLLCPICGRHKLNERDFSFVCPKCDQIWLLGTEATEIEKKKMRIQEADPLPGPCVDISEWDGSDFNTGLLVTARVVNLLERLQCGSFRAEPVAVDVSGLTDEQWKLLERAREPL